MYMSRSTFPGRRQLRSDCSRVHAALVTLAGVFAMAGCNAATGDADTTAAAEQVRLTLTGSSTIAPLMSEIGRRFEAEHPGIRVDVQTGGSSRGIADARGGLADIGMVSRDLKSDEQDLHAFPIARDGIGLIVHESNPVAKLSREQVIDIYTGNLGNWQEVGGKDSEIVVVHKASGRSTLELFLAHFGLRDPQVVPDVIIGDNEQGVKTVAGNPHAIGYVSIGTAEFDQQQGVPIRLLPIGGIAPTTANVANGTFPLSRNLNLVTREQPTGAARQLIDYARSAAVGDLITELAFVPLKPEEPGTEIE